MSVKNCSFVNTKGKRCRNKLYGDKFCKLHFDGATPDPQVRRDQGLTIYIQGLSKDEQDLYPDITTGNLKHEIRIARLQLRRLLKEQIDWDNNPGDMNKMRVSTITLKDAFMKNGVLIDSRGLPIDLKPAKPQIVNGVEVSSNPLIVDSTLTLTRPDFDSLIEKVINLISRLEKTNYELMSGSSDDPNHVAKQIHDMLMEMEANANGTAN